MPEAPGRREDETSTPTSQRRGPELWVLILVLAVAVAAVAGLLVLAA